jgi:HPt (histidine-containing phosphotransfer) domain-containing protein
MNEGNAGSLIGLFDDRIQKPLKLEQLKTCLERWIERDHLLQVQMLSKFRSMEGSVDEWESFMNAMECVKDIKIEYFLEFDKKDVEYFMRLIKSSRKQLNQAILTMNNTILSGDDKLAHEQLHALKSVLYYVGAHSLATLAEELDFKLIGEKDIQKRKQRFTEIMPNYQVLLERMTTLCSELEQAIHAYNSSIKNYQENFNETTSSIEDISKRIEQILFHVARFEYIEIFNGLNYLTLIASQEMKTYVNQAISALEEFEYERVEELLKDCWKEISENYFTKI